MGRKLMFGILAAALVMFTVMPFSRAAEPDGTVVFSGGSVAAGIGYSWGSGALTFRGQMYPFKVNGLSVGSVGAARTDASASVYNLKRLEDFNGTYTAVGAGATVAGGGVAVIMRNQQGVEIHVVGTTQGLDFKFAIEGVKFTLEM
jgi:hypothetical protein